MAGAPSGLHEVLESVGAKYPAFQGLALREHKQTIIQHVLNGRNCFVSLPTGYGKSHTYVLPTLILDERTNSKSHTSLVITPLLNLMKEQATKLQGTGVAAICVSADITKADDKVLMSGKAQVIFATPEAASHKDFKKQLRLLYQQRLALITCDESHRITDCRWCPSIIRIPGWVAEEEPDMVSLGLPFGVCRRIFLHLSLPDLARCMLVCKEWRSYIDTCDFWNYFLQCSFNLNLQTPPKWSVLREWRHRTSCLKISVTPKLDNDLVKPESYVFRPFLEMWRCGIVVAYGQEPPAGNVDQLHGFLKALQWLSRLKDKITELGLRQELNIEPCLMPWSKDRMPTPREVLDAFNAHIEIIRSACDARTLTPQELRAYYGLLRSRYRGPTFSDKLYYWFTDNACRANLIFDCDPNVVDPTPSFILTRLASGWVGGAIYAV